MATSKLGTITKTLRKAIDYMVNPEKTKDGTLVYTHGCSVETADLEMELTAKQGTGRGDRIAYHLIQSFAPDDDITPEKALELGIEYAKRVTGGKYEFVVSTHIDKEHIHNHIIFNAVDYVNHRKYHSDKKDKYRMMYFVYNYNHTEFDSIYQKLAQMHLQFERIHPFEDGNGRTGRLLLNYELIKNNLAPVVIPKEQRSTYFEMIGNNDSTALEEFLKKLSCEEPERINQMPVKGSVLEKLSGYQEQVKEKDENDRVTRREKTEREPNQETR